MALSSLLLSASSRGSSLSRCCLRRRSTAALAATSFQPPPPPTTTTTTHSKQPRPKQTAAVWKKSLFSPTRNVPAIGRYHASTPSTSQTLSSGRAFSTSSSTASEDDELPDRDVMAFDVLIVGGGPAGLAASIRLKQLDPDLSVCVLDKGSEIGAHILSGNVFDPKALDELLGDHAFGGSEGETWRDAYMREQGSHATPVTSDQFQILTEDAAYTIPNVFLPSQLHNDGNYIISLSQLCRWLASLAEDMGVDIYPGFAASEVLHCPNTGGVLGVATRDAGLDKSGQPKSTFERGVALHARQTLFAEGARGSCSEYLMEHYQLRDGVHPQTYGLGIKEVWEVPPEAIQPGLVQHTLGFPLQSSVTDRVFGGSFLYHQEPNLILVGLVIGLDYANPYINPYREFQKFKTHPSVSKQLEHGTCLSYGARVLNEGGYHAIPSKLTFPGGALIGCAAGFLNAVKIKGTHTAMKSGMVAAEAVAEALREDADGLVGESGEMPETHTPRDVTTYQEQLKDSWVYRELYEVRNAHQAFHKWGVGGGLAYTGLAAHVFKGREPWTLSHDIANDAEATEPAAKHEPRSYPAPDGKLTFDLLTNLQRSGTYHDDDQPSHLRVKQEASKVPLEASLPIYEGPEQRFCPAGVYEYVRNQDDQPELVINAQNCIHCKCCSIKTPKEYIRWTVPEGGGGPQYQVM